MYNVILHKIVVIEFAHSVFNAVTASTVSFISPLRPIFEQTVVYPWQVTMSRYDFAYAPVGAAEELAAILRAHGRELGSLFGMRLDHDEIYANKVTLLI